MDKPQLIEYVQTTDQSMTRPIEVDWLNLRLAHLRSADSAASGIQPGQDYIALSASPSGDRAAFVICDGVSESYFGELAARWLGLRLVEWLLGLTVDDMDSDDFRDALVHFLQPLPAAATAAVEEHQASPAIQGLLREALEEKRRIAGSQTMFAAVLATQRQLLVVRCGDVRVRILRTGDVPHEAHVMLHRTHAEHRWSSRDGIRGAIEFARFPAEATLRVQCSSDGLAAHDALLAGTPLTDADLNELIESTRTDARSDDVSFIELTILRTNQAHITPFFGRLESVQADSASEVRSRPAVAYDAEQTSHASKSAMRRIALFLIATAVMLLGLAYPAHSLLGNPSRPVSEYTLVRIL